MAKPKKPIKLRPEEILAALLQSAFIAEVRLFDKQYPSPHSPISQDRPVSQKLLTKVYNESVKLAASGKPLVGDDRAALATIMMESPPDVDDAILKEAFTHVYKGIERGIAAIEAFESKRRRRVAWTPHPRGILITLHNLLVDAFQIPMKRPGKLTKDGLKKRILLLVQMRITPKEISAYLCEQGYSATEARVGNINRIVYDARKRGMTLPSSPTARHKPRKR